MAGADTRNITLVGHGGAGKTTLAEAILFAAKMVSRQGSVGAQNTVSDSADDERDRGHSLDPAVMFADWKGKLVQILDAPGYPDFLGHALRGLDASDCAVMVVNAYDGVALNTRRLWTAAMNRELPAIVVINKCDADNIDSDAVIADIKAMCGTAAQFVTIPDQWGPGVSGMKSIFGEAADQKDGFVEAAVEADDDLMEKYLEAGEVSDDDLRKAIPAALKARTLVPIFCTCAESGVGVPELLDFIAEFGPSPFDRHIVDADGNDVALSADGPTLAVCFKVTFDRQAGRIAFLRLLSGGLASADTLEIARTEEVVKIGHASRFQGTTKIELPHAGIGDFAAIPKVDTVEIGDVLYASGSPTSFRLRPLPNPMVGLSIHPKSRGDETKLARELDRVTGADPCLQFERVASTNQLVLRGLSTLHLDTALKRMAKGGVEVDTAVPKVPYLESITGKADGHYRHKKQTGGAGQFGEVYLRVEPLARGADDPLEFENKTVGASIPRQFMPAVEKGVRQQMGEGVVAGYPVVDVKVEVYDGKHHDVDSKEIAFIIAGRRAFSLAVQAARPVLLEPVANVEIEIPSKFMGDISSDLNTRRARIQGMESMGDMQLIKCTAPLAEMQTYSTQLRSITGGQGSFSMDFSHYDVVPANEAQKIIKRAEAERKKEDD
ncbi:MAG: elongation factor G [Planctomycetota bacterium]|nr:elongation factor G [Planctomycetota bacterium]